MPEIGTSGLMSGERKRSVAEWPKLPRLSSTLLSALALRAAADKLMRATLGAGHGYKYTYEAPHMTD